MKVVPLRAAAPAVAHSFPLGEPVRIIIGFPPDGGIGADPVGSGPAELGAFMKAETERWTKVVRDGDIKAD